MVSASQIKKIESLGLAAILILGAFLRLYRIPDYMTFLGDEGRDAIVVRDILLGKNFPLIGPGTSVGNMYLGPIYYYLIAPSLLLSNFSPVGPAIFIAVLGVITIGLVWWVGRKWGMSNPTALAISALYAVSPVVITYSRSSWNPNIMPFFALLSVYGIWQVWRSPEPVEGQKHNWKWLVVSAVSFAFVLNSHYLGLLLAPTLGLFWWLSRKSLDAKRYTLISIFSFLLLLSPLVIFDASHNWINFNALKTFMTDRQQTVNLKAYKAVPNLWPIWSDVNTALLAGNNKQLGPLISIVILLTLTLTLTKKVAPELKLVIVWIGVGILGLGLYKQHIYAHYYGFLFPASFLLIGLLIQYSNRFIKYLLSAIVFYLLLFNIWHHPFRSDPNRQLPRTIQIAQFITEKAKGQPFNLALLSNHNYDASYRYFLALTNSPYFSVQEKVTDQLFVVCENSDSRPECQPVNNPQYEIAAFGWSKIEEQWSFPWQVEVYKLIHNPQGT